MALTYTPESSRTKTLPAFSGKTIFGEDFTDKSIKQNKVALFMFICNHCPYVQAIEERLIELGNYLKNRDVQVVAICSNDSTDHPEDSLENLQKKYKAKQYGFTYLHDEDQSLAKSFGAVCTPDFFVFNFQNNSNGELVYRGRLDDSWRDPDKVTKQELKMVIDQLLENNSFNIQEKPSMGCSIKWKS
ncbi:MAG: thioredoxin family protein [Bdellovibrionales bacterium]|nr:thioredoxin family protein [Bdellovibrionales bacterium]